MRTAGGIDGRNARRRAARRRHPDDLIAGRRVLRRARRPRSLDDDDPRTLRRPDRCVVEGTVRREPHRTTAAIGLDLVERSACVGPGHVREPLPVGRPRRHLLLDAVVREAARRAVRQIHHVQAVQRAEREAAAVRRRRRVADLTHQHAPRVHADRQVHHRPHLLVDLGGERDVGHLPGGHRQAVHLAPIRNDDRLIVGGERVSRIQIAREAGFLVVAGHRIHEPLLVARGKVAQAQPRFRVVARGVHQPFAIGRERRTHSAAVHVRLREEPAGLAVVDRQLPKRILQVVAEAAAVTRHPDVARILPERGAQRVHRRWLIGAGLHAQHRRARSAVLVNQPQLVDAAQHAAGPRDDDVVAVRRPVR